MLTIGINEHPSAAGVVQIGALYIVAISGGVSHTCSITGALKVGLSIFVPQSLFYSSFL